MVVLFVLKHVAVLLLLLVCAAAAGTLAIGPREGIALRSALGMAMWAHALFFLAAIGQLRLAPILALIVILAAAAKVEDRHSCLSGQPGVSVLHFAVLFPLALYPALAFDETLYHLPFVHAFAREGGLGFFSELRFPVFPVLHELLCVPPFLLAGDTGAHLVSVAQMMILAALLAEWGGRRAGWLAAAMFLGNPLVVHLGTILYVEIALALFVAAGFYALEHERYVLAGFFFGTACSVKYLGFYFALAALLIVIVRRRRVAAFSAACAITALPMTAWIALATRNPVFPFLGNSPWALAPWPSVDWSERALGMICVIWDATFARERAGLQPPVTPFLAILVAIVAVAAIRNTRARALLLLSAGYLAIFTFLPQDSRYLVALLPLVSLAAALVIEARWPRASIAVAILAIAPGIAYAGYRLMQYGLPPVTASARAAWLEQRVPEYRALRRAGTDRVYVCRAERLKSYAGGELLGDFNGPYSYDRMLAGGETAARLRRIGVPYFLVSKRACAAGEMTNGMALVYEDAHAQLWRVGSEAPPVHLERQRQ